MKKLIFLTFFSASILSGCTRDSGEVGSKSKPFQMFFIPSEDTKGLVETTAAVSTYLERFVSQKLYSKDTGFYIKTAIPQSYVAVIEAIGTKRADFAVINTFGYVLLKERKKYPAEAFLGTVREGNQKSYKGQIIARADSTIKSIKDLKGKKFAYVDSASSAGYVLPSLLFKKEGIELGSTVFAGKHDNVVAMVYQKQVDAGATYFSPESQGKPMDARTKVLTQYPDVLSKVSIIGFTQDIPNAPFVLRTDLYGEDKAKYERLKGVLQEGFMAFLKTNDGKAVMRKLYNIDDLVQVTDNDFTDVRKLFTSPELDLEKLMAK